MYGMTEEQFWKGDPKLAKVYRELYQQKQEAKNYEMWWQGFYFYEAMTSVASGFGKKPIKYPEKPHRITPETEEEKRSKAEAERKKAIASFTAWKDAWDKQHGKR